MARLGSCAATMISFIQLPETDDWIRIVINEFKILKVQLIQRFICDFQCWQFFGFPCELLFQSIDMIFINMSIYNGVGKGTRGEANLLCNRHCERGVTGQVKRNTQSDIPGALSQMAV